MTKKPRNEKWTYNAVKKAALSCENKSEFRKRFAGAEKWAIRKGVYAEMCNHMKPQFRWTFASVKQEAAKYATRNEFHNGNPSAAQWAIRNNRMNDLFHNVLTFWDLKSVSEEALKYCSREDFRRYSAGASQWAMRNGAWDKVCEHMDYLNKPVSEEEVISEASKYTSRSDFYYGSPRAYGWALRNKCLDKICSHMQRGTTASDANAIYLWSPNGMPDVFKIGVSSSRLVSRRIAVVAKAGGLDVDFSTARYCQNARTLEKEMLSIGTVYDWPSRFSGYSEFRRFEPHEIDVVFEMLNGLEEIAA